MARVIFDISMSLDGFIAGPNDGVGNGLGDGGERLHDWGLGLKSWREPHGLEGGETGPDDEVMKEAFSTSGAVVMGRRMFDLAEEPWGDEPPFHMPVFVVTHRERERLDKEGGTSFTFVTDGVEGAVERAKAAADGRDVSVAGGASVIQQCLQAGLVDEFQVHVPPVLLGAGRSLFGELGTGLLELEPDRVVDSSAVTHLRYRVRR